MQSIRVRVVRAFRAVIAGQMQVIEAGVVIDLPRAIAIDAITANKAERAAEEPRDEPKPAVQPPQKRRRAAEEE